MKVEEQKLNLDFVCPYPHCKQKGVTVTIPLFQILKDREYPRCPTCSDKLAYVSNDLYTEKCPRCKMTRIDPVGRGGKLCRSCGHVWGAD